jgi:hypothetical protein
MDWIIANWGQVLIIITQVVGVAALVATLTPNQSDNAVIDTILKVINTIGGNVGKAKNG